MGHHCDGKPRKWCPYRNVYGGYALRPGTGNSVRSESMEPVDRCGDALKDDCMGGSFWDYHPCTNPRQE